MIAVTQELRLECEGQRTELERQQAVWESRIAESKAAGSAALQVAQAESAASAGRCAAFEEQLGTLQRRCNALQSTWRLQVAELAAAADENAVIGQQLTELQQRAAELQRQLGDNVLAAAAATRQLQAEFMRTQQHVAEAEATNGSLRCVDA